MLFRMNYTVQWLSPDGEWRIHRNPEGVPFGVRAVSRRHALQKTLGMVTKLPCFSDRERFGDEVQLSAEVTFAEGTPS